MKFWLESDITESNETTVYKLTLDENHEIIEVFVDGEATPIDVVAGI